MRIAVVEALLDAWWRLVGGVGAVWSPAFADTGFRRVAGTRAGVACERCVRTAKGNAVGKTAKPMVIA